MGVFRYVVCDVFTDRALSGNQLAVFTDARKIPEGDLQGLAREMAFSETVFVYPANGDAHVRLRIFTPEAELPFAGHPVLGSAFVLGGPLQAETVRFETGVGVIPVRLEREGARIVFGRMTQPVPTWEPFAQTDELLAALGVDRSELPVEVYDNGLKYVYVVLSSVDDVARLEPDLRRLGALPEVLGTNCLAGSGRTWKTRMFAPGGRRPGGSGHRVGGGAARGPPPPSRPRRLGRGGRDLPGRRAQPPFDPLRDCLGDSRADRARRGRRQRGRRCPRGVPALSRRQ